MKPKLKRIVALLTAATLLLSGGGYLAYQAYISARQARLVRQAHASLAKHNDRKALLSLQRALRYNPNDLEACRLMAAIAERSRSPAALLLRSRVVELNPRSLEDRLALAQTAMTFNDYGVATNALSGVDVAGKRTAAYLNLAGAVETSANQLAQAEADFREAARLEPTNLAPQLNLAVLHLQSTNAQAIAEARATLTRLSAIDSALRPHAVRQLLLDAMRTKQTNAATSLSKELIQLTNSVFTDRLLRLDVLLGNQKAEAIAVLPSFQREAGTNLANVYELARWQMSRLGPADTLTWLRTLPPATRTNQPVTLLVAHCQVALGDWKGLQASLDPQRWSELEFVRHALRARALRGQDLTGGAKAEWELALKATGNQKQALSMLLGLAAQWGWQSEAEELLWAIVNRYPEDKAAFQALSQSLFAGGRTRSLMQLYSQQLKRLPSDPGVKNNLAMTALLLEATEMRPHDLAREVYEQVPTNSSYASTYAFSLYTQSKCADALKVLQRLRPEELENPSIAGYYGLILKATGDRAKAMTYLQRASKAALLPEELKLFDRAKSGA